MSELTTQKLVFAGDTVYLYHFEKPIAYGPKDPKKKKKGDPFVKIETTKEENRKRAMWRARGKMVLLVNTNYGKWKMDDVEYFNPVFLTLTFAENVTNIKEANYEFTKFIQRLNNHIMGKKGSYLKYVNAIEFQKRGAVHYHCVIFNMPFIKKGIIEDIWGHGFIFINKIKESNVIGLYISKYITKAFDDKRLYEEKCYFISRGLKQPLVVCNIRDINFFISFLPIDKPVRITSYESEYQGQVDVFQYDLRKGNNSYESFQNLFAMKYGPIVK